MIASPRFHLRQMRQTLGIIWRSSRGWFAANLALVLLQSLLPLLGLYVFKLILNRLEAAIGQNAASDFAPLLGLIGLALLLSLLGNLGQALSRLAQEEQALATSASLYEQIQTKSAEIDYAYLEHPQYHDLLYRARREVAGRPAQITSNIATISLNSLSLLGIMVFLLSINWLLALALGAAILPGVAGRLITARRMYNLDRRLASASRKADYLHYLITGLTSAKEIRLFDLGGLFRQRFSQQQEQVRRERLRLNRAGIGGEFVGQAALSLTLYGALALLAAQALGGGIALSTLVVTYQAFVRAQQFLGGILGEGARLYENNLYVAAIYEFLALPSRMAPPSGAQSVPKPLRQGISFERVTFSYPGNSQPSLREVSLTIRPGQVVALVGQNGCGKSTLVKLLCRLYDPDAGCVMYDGTDYRAFDPAELRRQVSVIFQDYIWYQLLNVHESIALGASDRPIDRAATVEAARESDADGFVERLPQGYETVLGKEFDNGVGLSVGQWQKVALARALYRQAQVLVLDEPSSALDPLAEAEVFAQFERMRRDRAALLISHRLANVKFADWIYVLDEGRVVEQGDHEQLMRQEGKYHQMFEAQARQYR